MEPVDASNPGQDALFAQRGEEVFELFWVGVEQMPLAVARCQVREDIANPMGAKSGGKVLEGLRGSKP